ncbi:MAG: TRAP transporter small permease [Alphaproteobacteria bacterium]|nr:TRAP transporter small permease [Alphaproteobacteria bacterium]
MNAITRVLDFALSLLRRIVDVVLIALMAYMVGAVLAQVFGRYLFNYSIAAAVETATFAQIWMVLLGAGYAMRQRMHVSIDIVIQALPAAVSRILLVPVAGLCLWFIWVVFEGGLRMLELGAIQRSPALQISMEIPYVALPLSAAYLALETALVFAGGILGRAAPVSAATDRRD